MKMIRTEAEAREFYDAVSDWWAEKHGGFQFGDPCGICHRPIRVAAMWSPVNGFVCEPCGKIEREAEAA